MLLRQLGLAGFFRFLSGQFGEALLFFLQPGDFGLQFFLFLVGCCPGVTPLVGGFRLLLQVEFPPRELGYHSVATLFGNERGLGLQVGDARNQPRQLCIFVCL